MLEKKSIIKNITIEKVIFNGFGLAHYDGHIIMIYQGIIGDNVDVSLVHKRGDTYFANIVNYNKKSTYQIPVECKHFDLCGGCDWLNVDYATQLRFKQDIIEEVYRYNLSDELSVSEIIPSPKVSHYRNKIVLPVRLQDKQIKTGMYARRSHDVIPHHECFLHPQGSDSIINLTEELLTKAKISVYHEQSGKGNLRFIGIRYSETRKEHLLIIVTSSAKLPFTKILTDNLSNRFPSIKGIVQDINTGDSNRNISSQAKTLYGNDYLTEDLGSVSLRIHYSAFFQVNTSQCLNVINHLKKQLKASDIVIDAYSGIGTFGISIAGEVKKVILLEQHQEAVSNGLYNIKENGLDNCIYMPGKVEDTLSQAVDSHQADTIIFDPPRKGLDANILETVVRSQINKIFYISCNASTQKRDVDLLIKGGFKLTAIRPFDMFPHTHHIECLAVLHR